MNQSERPHCASGSMKEQLITYGRLDRALRSLRTHYAQAEPFPHVVIDDFLETEAAEQALAEFPPIDALGWICYRHVNENKLGNPDRSTFGPTLGRIIDQLNGPLFLRFLANLTGIDGLLADDTLQGGGLHQSERGGFLNVHADFTVHPYHLTWRRRVNLLIYLNKEWKESYEGHLELWDRQMRQCVCKIAPIFNRAVIFNTDVDSFHGHPGPVACPPGMTRKSLALFYYTQELKPPLARSAEYRARPGDGLRALAIYLDKMVLRLYTALKWRLGISDHLASRVLQVLSGLKRK